MALRPYPIAPVPDATACLARAACPTGTPSLPLRDTLGSSCHDADCAALLPATGQPRLPPWRLALVTLRQLRDNLSARQAAEAVRAQIDWQDLVGLALTDPGVDYAVWCALRARVVSGNAAAMGLDTGLACCRAWGWLKTRGTQRTDAPPVMAALRVRTRRA